MFKKIFRKFSELSETDLSEILNFVLLLLFVLNFEEEMFKISPTFNCYFDPVRRWSTLTAIPSIFEGVNENN